MSAKLSGMGSQGLPWTKGFLLLFVCDNENIKKKNLASFPLWFGIVFHFSHLLAQLDAAGLLILKDWWGTQ